MTRILCYQDHSFAGATNMKISGILLAAACMALATVPAVAMDLERDAGRILTDPNYLPLAGQIWGSTEFEHLFGQGNIVNGAGVKTGSFHSDINNWEQRLGYGILDDLAVEIKINYQPGSTRKITYTNGQSLTRNTNGVSDPTIGLTYRVLDQERWPVTLDIFASYTPDAFKSTAASMFQSGTIARGGASETAGLAIAEETQDITVRGFARANFMGASQTDKPDVGVTVKQTSYTNFDAGLQTQTRLSRHFSLNVDLVYTIADNSTLTNTSNGNRFLSHPGNSEYAEAAFNCALLPEKLVGTIFYRYTRSEKSLTIRQIPANNTGVNDRNANVIGGKLSYEFF